MISRKTLLLIITIFITSLGLSQNSEPLRKDNLIQIQTDSTADFNIVDFGRHLISKGYTFEKVDKDFLTIVTDPMAMKGIHYKFKIAFIDSKINIRVNCELYNGFVHEVQWVDWDYRTSGSNYMNKFYKKFIPDLESYGKPILYFNE